MWAGITLDTLAKWPARTRGKAFLRESFHIIEAARAARTDGRE
jgi:hypothetical protein